MPNYLSDIFFKRISLPLVDFFRETNALKIYPYLLQSQWLKRSELEDIQWRKLKDLLNHAYSKVRYYKRIFDERGLKPEDITSPDDLKKLPILTKNDVRKNFNDLISLDFGKRYPKESSTSGSTGEPLTYYIDKLTHGYYWANAWRGWGAAGYSIGEKYAAMSGGALLPNKLEFKRKLYLSMSHCLPLPSFHINKEILEKYKRLMLRHSPKYIYGYPSSIYLFAKSLGYEQPNLKAVITTSEMLYSFQRELVEEKFNCKIFDEYGARDAGIISFECNVHNGFHYNMESVYVEIVNDQNKTLSCGEVGNIISTSLVNYTMPFIRYAPGDLGILAESGCQCGRGLTKISKIAGRNRDFILTTDGRYIHGAFWNSFNPFYKYNWINQFQIIQKRRGEIVVKLVPRAAPVQSDIDELIRELQVGLGKIDVVIELVDKIDLTNMGKYKLIVSEIEDNSELIK